MSEIVPTPMTSAMEQLSQSTLKRSGSLFYSGPSAFVGHRDLYILGLNPGGSPVSQAHETVARDLENWKARTKPWSAYIDDSWLGRPPGKHGMQPRMRHAFDQLGVELREVPASNVVFVRSATEAALGAEKTVLFEQWDEIERRHSEVEGVEDTQRSARGESRGPQCAEFRSNQVLRRIVRTPQRTA